MPNQVDLGFAATREPRAVVEYFRAKGYNITWDWHEAWEVAHARAFTVAKAVRLDVLSGIRQELDKAIAKGTTRRQFVRGLEPRLRRLGWWGRQMVGQPGGPGHVVQLGSPHRLRTIFDTNVRTAYAAARYRQQSDNAASRPFWMYSARRDGRTRPSHAALDGRVFPHDDPFWTTHYPPNGWNCRCRVRPLTAKQVEQRGIRPSSSRGQLTQVQQRAGVDKQTGEIIERPGIAYRFRDAAGKEHVLLPDPGWSYNPGAGATFGPIDGDPTRLDAIVGDGGKTWRHFGLPARPASSPAPPRRRAAKSPDAALHQIEQALDRGGRRRSITRADGKQDTVFGEVVTPEGLDNVMLTGGFVRHLARGHGRDQFVEAVIPTLTDPAEVWLQPTLVKGRVFYRRVFIAAFDRAGEGPRQRGRGAVVVAQEDPLGILSWTFVPPKQAQRLNNRRRGYLLYRRGDAAGEE